MKKRYPRGKIITKTWSGIGEAIDLKEYGIFYLKEGTNDTIFLPHHKIDRIEYEEIPKELRNEEG